MIACMYGGMTNIASYITSLYPVETFLVTMGVSPRERCKEAVKENLMKTLDVAYGDVAEEVYGNLVAQMAKVRTLRDADDPSNDTVRGIDGGILGDVPTAHFGGDDRDAIPGDLSGILMQLAVSPSSEPNEGASKQELKCIAAIAHHIK